MATKAATDKDEKPAAEPAAPTAKVRFNSASLKSSYANFCNATSTREEVVLNFGVSNNG